jgi:tetratricopeptide (TPR) repeat protein
LRDEYIDEALKLAPSSYVLRRDALYYLSPENGGSYAKMPRFLVETKNLINENPDLELLMGYLFFVKSWDAYSSYKYRRTIRLTTLALKNRNEANYYVQRANAYFSLEAYEAAVIDYTNAIILQAFNPDLYYWRAYSYLEMAQPEMALKDLEQASRLFPYNRDVLIKLGHVSGAQGHYRQSEEAYKTTLVYDPDNPYLWYNIGRNLYFGEGKAEEALPSLKKATEIDPEAAIYWYAYGAALSELGDCTAVFALKKTFGNMRKRRGP